jgi:hypothetical protein
MAAKQPMRLSSAFCSSVVSQPIALKIYSTAAGNHVSVQKQSDRKTASVSYALAKDYEHHGHELRIAEHAREQRLHWVDFVVVAVHAVHEVRVLVPEVGASLLCACKAGTKADASLPLYSKVLRYVAQAFRNSRREQKSVTRAANH